MFPAKFLNEWNPEFAVVLEFLEFETPPFRRREGWNSSLKAGVSTVAQGRG